MQRVVLPGGAVTWTVLDEHARVVGPAEEFLEFLRVQASSPNTASAAASRSWSSTRPTSWATASSRP